MQSFLSTFPKYVHVTDVLVLGVSGGVDSMVMLDLVLQVHPKENIIVAHFDHALRGESSDEDRKFVRDTCASQGIEFFEKKVDIARLASEQKSSLEAIAREERYQFLEHIQKVHDAKYILTAHHADDQVETMILNLLKGGKFQGISGMSSLSGNIFRPLLQETKHDIIAYAEVRNIHFREDASNQDITFERNKIRHRVVPVLLEINPSLHRTFSHLATHSSETQEYISQQAEKWLTDEERLSQKQRVFHAKNFGGLSPILQREIIACIYRNSHDGSSQGLSTGFIKEMIRFITERSNSHGFKEVKNIRMERKGDWIHY